VFQAIKNSRTPARTLVGCGERGRGETEIVEHKQITRGSREGVWTTESGTKEVFFVEEVVCPYRTMTIDDREDRGPEGGKEKKSRALLKHTDKKKSKAKRKPGTSSEIRGRS